MPFSDINKKKEYHKEYEKKYYIKNPWKKHLKEIKSRCNNKNRKTYKYYGGRGIKNLISEEEIKELWFRDKAYNMKKPSVDRIDNDGHYEYNNCRFIELTNNIIKSNKESNIKPILQFDINGILIKKWKSITQVEIELQIDHRQICNNLKNKQKTCHGFIFKYEDSNS